MTNHSAGKLRQTAAALRDLVPGHTLGVQRLSNQISAKQAGHMHKRAATVAHFPAII